MFLPAEAGEVHLDDPVVDEPDPTPAGQLFRSDRGTESLDDKDPCRHAVETATRSLTNRTANLDPLRALRYGWVDSEGQTLRAVAIIDVPMIEIIDGMVSMGWAFGV
jgi:hypothetical protein